MHGKFPKAIHESHVETPSSLQWLSDGYLYPETEGFIMAIQDRVCRTRNYEKHCMNMPVVDKCRKCGTSGETIEHIMAGCTALADSAYLGRHNQLAKIVHRQLALKHGMLNSGAPPYYKYNPAPVMEANNTIIYWDRPIFTDKTVAFNRPDIVLIDRNKKEAILVDIAVPLTHNLKKTETEKITKYEDLALEIKQMWKLQSVKTYPLVISAEGVVSKNFRKNLKLMGLPQRILNYGQKAVILQTCHIVRKFLN